MHQLLIQNAKKTVTISVDTNINEYIVLPTADGIFQMSSPVHVRPVKVRSSCNFIVSCGDRPVWCFYFKNQ